MSARPTVGKSPRELLACCRVEDGKAKLPVRIAQLLEQGHFLSTRHYCLGALAKKVRQGAVGKFSSFIIIFVSFLLAATWRGRLLRAGLMSTGAKSGMRRSASPPHLNSPVLFPLWEAVGHLGRVTWRDRWLVCSAQFVRRPCGCCRRRMPRACSFVCGRDFVVL